MLQTWIRKLCRIFDGKLCLFELRTFQHSHGKLHGNIFIWLDAYLGWEFHICTKGTTFKTNKYWYFKQDHLQTPPQTKEAEVEKLPLHQMV